MALADAHSDAHADLDDVGKNIAHVIKVLCTARQATAEELAEAADIPKSTLYRRLKNGLFTGPELARIATVLDVSPAVFFDPVDTLFRSR